MEGEMQNVGPEPEALNRPPCARQAALHLTTSGHLGGSQGVWLQAQNFGCQNDVS